MPKVTFTCLQCGQQGECFPSQKRQFCSTACKARWFGSRPDKVMPRKPRRGETVPCENCGEAVYRSRSQAILNKRFCSVKCHNESQRNGESRPCLGCGEPFYVSPSVPSQYCSRDCYETARLVKSSAGRMHNGRPAIRDHAGYIRVWEPDHPAASQGRVLEHRLIMEEALGRFLRTEEHVHHINHQKDDNRLENLRLMSADDHRSLTAQEVKERRTAMETELAEYRRRFGPLESA